jgi:hypothetical protein
METFLFTAPIQQPPDLILIAAAILSFALPEHTDGLIIIGIVLFSGLMGSWREKVLLMRNSIIVMNPQPLDCKTQQPLFDSLDIFPLLTLDNLQ